VFRTKRRAQRFVNVSRFNPRKMVKVWVDPEDVVAADPNQIAVKRLRIYGEDWTDAELPPDAIRLRMV
jgi:hypothetical protein